MLRPSTTKNIRKSRKPIKYNRKGRIKKNFKNRSDKDRLVKEIDKAGLGFRRKKRKGDEKMDLNKNNLSQHNHKNPRKSRTQMMMTIMMIGLLRQPAIPTIANMRKRRNKIPLIK